MNSTRNFAIVPAAGLSLRMGNQHKLLLPWDAGQVIDAVLRAWTQSHVDVVVVVVRSGDTLLQRACQRWPIELVTPDLDPVDMKHSIRIGLEHLAATHQPASGDRWLTAPADLPRLCSSIINQIIATPATSTHIVVPRFGQRTGHPICLPWSLHAEVSCIPDDAGLNWLLAHHPLQHLELPADGLPEDIDTPHDYQRLFRAGKR
jgi:molybdenum cofactor cytidylyltransferase